jgi:hypothetical protein
MNNKRLCTYLTKRGKPCRNQALSGSEPPACHRHQRVAAGLPAPLKDSGHHLQLIALEEYEEDAMSSLLPELQLVRRTLYLLKTYLDNPDCALEPRELRELARTIFSGARTAAYLLSQQGRKGNGLEAWFTRALDRLAEEYGLEV